MTRGRPPQEPSIRNLEIYHELVCEDRLQSAVAARFRINQSRVAQIAHQVRNWIDRLLPATAKARLLLLSGFSLAAQSLHLAIALRRHRLSTRLEISSRTSVASPVPLPTASYWPPTMRVSFPTSSPASFRHPISSSPLSASPKNWTASAASPAAVPSPTCRQHHRARKRQPTPNTRLKIVPRRPPLPLLKH